MRIVEQVRERRRAEPFVPFAVLTTEGKRFVVPECDRVSYSPNLRYVVVWNYDEDGFEIIGEESVAGVEAVPQEEAIATLAKAS